MNQEDAVPTPAEFARVLVDRYKLTPSDLVIEVGSGDGARLRAVRDLGPRVVGVEPDIVAMVRAWNAGVDTIRAAFDGDLVRYLLTRYGLARLVVAHADSPALREAAAVCVGSHGAVHVVDAAPDVRRAA